MSQESPRPAWVVGHFDLMGSVPGSVRHTGPVSYPESAHPRVSVISPAYRHRRYLDSTLFSIATQDCPEFEHIVIDGASGDGTVEYLESCPNLIWISEPDTGYVDAFHKGLTRARGEFVLQCAVSDGLLVNDWMTRCVQIFETLPETALVWGVPRSMAEDGHLGEVVYQDLFPDLKALSARDTFQLWLTRGFVLPEGNLCVRADVLRRLFPTVAECLDPTVEPWLEFTTRFHEAGYMAVGLPVAANYGRAHSDSITAYEFDAGTWRVRRNRFSRQVSRARRAHVMRGDPKIFVDISGAQTDVMKLTSRQRILALGWSVSDAFTNRLRPGLGLLPDSARETLRSLRSRLLRSR